MRSQWSIADTLPNGAIVLLSKCSESQEWPTYGRGEPWLFSSRAAAARIVRRFRLRGARIIPA